MKQYISKSALVAEIERIKEMYCYDTKTNASFVAEAVINSINNAINSLEVKDPYEQCVQYPSVKDGIKAHAETYSFNVESELFNQLTKEQQTLWRKEIEQACISGGEAGVELARDPRYKENLEVKEVDLEKEVINWWNAHYSEMNYSFEGYAGHYLENFTVIEIAKHFFELGLNTQHSSINIPNIDDTLKEEGLDPNSKKAKVFKESYYMALEKLKAQKEE